LSKYVKAAGQGICQNPWISGDQGVSNFTQPNVAIYYTGEENRRRKTKTSGLQPSRQLGDTLI
jgi:hypothetical protein